MIRNEASWAWLVHGQSNKILGQVITDPDCTPRSLWLLWSIRNRRILWARDWHSTMWFKVLEAKSSADKTSPVLGERPSRCHSDDLELFSQTGLRGCNLGAHMVYTNALILCPYLKDKNLFSQSDRQNSIVKVVLNGEISTRLNLGFLSQYFLVRRHFSVSSQYYLRLQD